MSWILSLNFSKKFTSNIGDCVSHCRRLGRRPKWPHHRHCGPISWNIPLWPVCALPKAAAIAQRIKPLILIIQIEFNWHSLVWLSGTRWCKRIRICPYRKRQKESDRTHRWPWRRSRRYLYGTLRKTRSGFRRHPSGETPWKKQQQWS